MAYENQIKCTSCGKSIPPQPEDATTDELLCDLCLASLIEGDFVKIASHAGHNVVVSIYGDNVNVAVECEDCYEVLIDFDSAAPEFAGLLPHFGHHIEVALAGSQVEVKCATCDEIIVIARKNP